jgi:hypothetical protein
MQRQDHRSRRWVAGVLAAAGAATALAAVQGARADEAPAPVCPSSTDDAYVLGATALTGPSATDVSLRLHAAPGCAEATTVKHLQIKTFDADGTLTAVRNLREEAVADGTAAVALPRVGRGLRIEVAGEVQTGTPQRTYVVHDATTSRLRPDLVVTAVDAPAHVLVGKAFDVTVHVTETNGDTGANAHVTLGDAVARIGDPLDVAVAAGGTASVTFAAVSLGAAVSTELTLDVQGAAPAEYDATNGARHATVDVTKSELASPFRVLFPSLTGYGAQFNNHLYAPISTARIPSAEYPDIEQKVKALEPQIVRIFYNDNWEENVDGTHPEFAANYASFVHVVELAQEAGATIVISYQNLGNLAGRFQRPIPVMMARFADALQDLVVAHGLVNVGWAEVGNEPNAGVVTTDQYKALYQALNDELVRRGLRSQVKLMGAGVVENGATLARDHYAWMTWTGTNMSNLLDAYSEHVYWQYNDPGRLEYRLRDVANVMGKVLPPDEQKPVYLMEFGVRGDATCGAQPRFANLYYGADPSCPEIWRTNIAGFQQLWFAIGSAQLGFAGAAKWDAYWAVYDRNSVNQQVYWMTGPPSEGYPLTPTYEAMSLLFHVTAPGWQIVGVDPWDDSDWSVPTFHQSLGDTSNDQPEQELAAYAGPNGELTVLGLDTHGKALNTASTDPPSSYSIAGLPPETTFTLALWNASGDGTDSIGGTVTTSAAGVARFDVPLQAAFALTNVPVS